MGASGSMEAPGLVKNLRRWKKLKTYDKRHRFLNCKEYESCLTEAALLHWESFTCWACPLNPYGQKPSGTGGTRS